MHIVTLAQAVIRPDLLPTVRAAQGDNRNSNVWLRDKGQPQNLENIIATLLPTTTASDWKGANNSGSGSASANGIATVATNLLPTTTARDHKDGQAKYYRDGKLQTDLITRAVNELTGTWGKFAPAIQRWEQTIGRPAPAPTLPDGKDSKHRLNSAFTEWMMGLPEGWITNTGLTRAEELKACGNGVVPQQAKLALAILLEGVKW